MLLLAMAICTDRPRGDHPACDGGGRWSGVEERQDGLAHFGASFRRVVRVAVRVPYSRHQNGTSSSVIGFRLEPRARCHHGSQRRRRSGRTVRPGACEFAGALANLERRQRIGRLDRVTPRHHLGGCGLARRPRVEGGLGFSAAAAPDRACGPSWWRSGAMTTGLGDIRHMVDPDAPTAMPPRSLRVAIEGHGPAGEGIRPTPSP